jgi:NADH:ubiquinone oxidoreductase subunit K
MTIPLHWYLIVAAALFCIGLYGVLSRRNAIGILMGIELMLFIAIYRSRDTVIVEDINLMKG